MRPAVIACCGLLLCVADVRADTVYATSVEFFSGSSTGEDPNHALGAPDIVLTQLVDNGAILTLDFGSLLTAPGTLSIFTIDDLFPAAAPIAISADASTFTLLSAFVTDANGQVAPPFSLQSIWLWASRSAM